MVEEDELLDLVDENDQVTGTILRSRIMGEHEGYLRASEMFIINDQGRLWVPRRQLHKRIAPGGLDYSGAGHVASGEDYEEALLREIKEELNFDIDKSKLEFLHKFSPKPDLPPYFRAVYLYHSNETPDYNKDDFSEAFWMTPQDLLARLKAGEPAKKNIAETVEYLLSIGLK